MRFLIFLICVLGAFALAQDAAKPCADTAAATPAAAKPAAAKPGLLGKGKGKGKGPGKGVGKRQPKVAGPGPALECRKDEVLVPCSNGCPEASCDSFFKGTSPPCRPPLADHACVPACRCPPGKIRDSKNGCVKVTKCCPGKHAHVIECPNPCSGGTCQTPAFGTCKQRCKPYGCQCKRGYVKLSDKDAKCVKQSRCAKIALGINKSMSTSMSYSYSFSYSVSASSSSSCETVVTNVVPPAAGVGA